MYKRQIAQREVVDAEEVAFLQEVVGVELLVLETGVAGAAKDIGEVALVAVYGLEILVGSHVVINIPSESAVTADGEIPVLVGELRIESEVRRCV